MPGWDVRVLGESGTEADAGEIGALVVKLPLPPGTLADALERGRALSRGLPRRVPGYYKTADAGFMDEDGYVFVMARTDDIINVAGAPPVDRRDGGGARVAPRRGRVRGASAWPTRSRARCPSGFVVLKAGVERPHDDIVAEVVALVREQIGPVAAFKTAVVVKRLPKTRSGKILRGTMQKIADGEEYSVPATIDDPAILDEIGRRCGGRLREDRGARRSSLRAARRGGRERARRTSVVTLPAGLTVQSGWPGIGGVFSRVEPARGGTGSRPAWPLTCAARAMKSSVLATRRV